MAGVPPAQLKQPKTVAWHALHLQFGAGTRLLKHFKPRFARDLELAMAVYPDAGAEPTESGIQLRPSPPPVVPRLRPVANSRTATPGTTPVATSD